MKNIDIYQQGCLQTESKPDVLVENGKQAIALTKALTDIVSLGARADVVKKHLFYKKPSSDIEALVNIRAKDWTELQNLSPQIVRILHCILGLQSELEELTQPILDHLMEGKPLDLVNLMEEMGDHSWYLSIGLDAVGFSFSEALHRNRVKLLEKRFKKGYSDKDALNRDLDSEREALETAKTSAASECLMVAELLAFDCLLDLHIDKKANKITYTMEGFEAYPFEMSPEDGETLTDMLANMHSCFSKLEGK